MGIDFNLPDLILLQDFGGDWSTFYEHIYQCFRKDFVTNPLRHFNGKKLALKRYPLSSDNKEATFYHITHEGQDEQDREPDLRRMERIRWPKFMLMNFSHSKLKVWQNKRGSDKYILIFNEEEDYLLVLADRGSYVLPWTAYVVTYNKRRTNLIKEYEAYKKAEAAKLT